MINLTSENGSSIELAAIDKSTCSADAVVYIVLQTLTILLNIVAAIFLSKLKGYKKNTSHLVVQVLVVSDALGAVSNLIPIVLSCTGYNLIRSDVCQAFGFVSNVLLLWTVLIVLLMCALRYFAVVRPLFYRTRITYSIVRWTLFGLLIWSAIHILLPLLGIGRFKFYSHGQYCAFEIPPRRTKDFALVHLIVWEGWFLTILLICFTVRMVKELRAKKKWTSRMSFQQRRGVQANGLLQKGYTMMTVVIVTIFLVCYIPFLTYRALTLLKKHVDESYHFYLHLLAHINPMLNPILYVSCNRGYKSALRSMLARVCSCFAEPMRRTSKSNSISMSLFSYATEDGTLSRIKRLRASTTTTFLQVPSRISILNRPCAEEKAAKKRRNKRNSIDVSDIGSPTRGLQKEFVFTKRGADSIIDEVFENKNVADNVQDVPHSSNSMKYDDISATIIKPPHLDVSTLGNERKLRGISISSIVYDVEIRTLPKTLSQTSNDVINNGQTSCDRYDDEVFVTDETDN